MFLALLLAVNATGAPLFVPPKGMHHLRRDPAVAAQIRNIGLTFVAEYRGTVHQRMGRVVFPRSIAITIGTDSNSGFDARGYAKARLLFVRQGAVKVVSGTAVPLCGGRSGWLTKMALPGSDVTVEEMYAEAADTVYVAQLVRPKSIHDPFNSEKSLYSLCPPGSAVAERQTPAGSMPLVPPAGWARGILSDRKLSPPFELVGLWLHPMAFRGAVSVESLALSKAPPLPANVTPQDENEIQMSDLKTHVAGAVRMLETTAQKLCNGTADGWVTRYVTGGWAVERAYVYGKSLSYFLTYSHRLQTPENPVARAAIDSLCAE